MQNLRIVLIAMLLTMSSCANPVNTTLLDAAKAAIADKIEELDALERALPAFESRTEGVETDKKQRVAYKLATGTYGSLFDALVQFDENGDALAAANTGILSSNTIDAGDARTAATNWYKQYSLVRKLVEDFSNATKDVVLVKSTVTFTDADDLTTDQLETTNESFNDFKASFAKSETLIAEIEKAEV